MSRIRKKRPFICMTVCGSDSNTLRFTNEAEYLEYKAAETELNMQTYLKLRAKYGIYASNQGKYVNSVVELNNWEDGDEIRLAAYLKEKQ